MTDDTLSATGPGGWGIVARGASTIVILVLAAAMSFIVWTTQDSIAQLRSDHRILQREMAIASCIQTLTAGERQALRFNRNSPWQAWCWWMEEIG